MGNETVKRSVRAYSVCLGVFEYKDSFSTKQRKVIAEYAENITEIRGLKDCEAAGSDIRMAKIEYPIRSGLSAPKVSFEYEDYHMTSECHRANEAGFYTRTITEVTCVKVSTTDT